MHFIMYVQHHNSNFPSKTRNYANTSPMVTY